MMSPREFVRIVTRWRRSPGLSLSLARRVLHDDDDDGNSPPIPSAETLMLAQGAGKKRSVIYMT